MKPDKWITQSRYVDLHSGEVITKKEAETKYQIINKIKEYEQRETYVRGRREITGIVTWTKECRRKPEQRRLW